MTQTTSDTTDPRAWVRITEDLREKLRSGAIAPGDTVTIGQLSGQWGTSRSPAAKALHALEADGLVRRYPGIGYYVLSPRGQQEAR
jgi:DNA-binding GntR family transcriptional regulator